MREDSSSIWSAFKADTDSYLEKLDVPIKAIFLTAKRIVNKAGMTTIHPINALRLCHHPYLPTPSTLYNPLRSYSNLPQRTPASHAHTLKNFATPRSRLTLQHNQMRGNLSISTPNHPNRCLLINPHVDFRTTSRSDLPVGESRIR